MHVNPGYLLMVVTAAIWSGNAIVGRAVHEFIPPVGLSFWRFAFALPIFLALAWPHLRNDFAAALRAWPLMLVLSVLSVSIYNSFIYIGLDRTTAINMVLINTARPVVIVLMSLVVFRVPVTPVQALGLALGLVGTGVIVFRGDLGAFLSLQLNIGDLWILAATFAWATYTVFLHKRPKMHPAGFLAVTTVIGLVVLLPFYVAESVFVEPMPLLPVTLATVVYLAIFSSVLGYLGFNRVVEILGANRAGLTSYLIPIFGVTLAIFLLDETFHFFHAIGIFLLILGTWLGSRGAHPAR